MSNLNFTFEWIHQCYMSWFRDHAKSGAVPKSEKELAGYYFDNEDVFDDGHVLLNRVVYFVPMKPSESKSGRTEVFGFTELNLMKQDKDGDIDNIVSVEYTLL